MSIAYAASIRHSGIKGQKWGIRRFQNKDRTWTEAGKVRYGNPSGEKKEKKEGLIKKYAKRKIQDFKAKHPWMMSDDELRERAERLELEQRYKDALKKPLTKGQQFVATLMMEGGSKLILGAVDRKIEKAKARQQRQDARRRSEDQLENLERELKMRNKLSLDFEDKKGKAQDARTKDLEAWRNQNTRDLEDFRNKNTRDLESWRNQNTKDLEKWRRDEEQKYNIAKRYAEAQLIDYHADYNNLTTDERKERLDLIDSLYGWSSGKSGNQKKKNNNNRNN